MIRCPRTKANGPHESLARRASACGGRALPTDAALFFVLELGQLAIVVP